MGKRKNRQPDPPSNETANVSESSEEVQSEDRTYPKCNHAAKSISLSELRKKVGKEGFKKKCADCEKSNSSSLATISGNNDIIPSEWICLSCGVELCGESHENHHELHYKTPHSGCHCIFVNLLDRTNCWCFECDKSIRMIKKNRLREAIDILTKADKIIHIPEIVSDTSAIKNSSKFVKCNDETKGMNFPKVKGLRNLGNTCFFNAVMQCLVQTPYLVKVLEDLKEPGEKFQLSGGELKLQDDNEKKDQEKEDDDLNTIKLEPIHGTLDGWGELTSVLHKTLTILQNPNNDSTYCPSELLNTLRDKTKSCTDGGQHDSHELLRLLLEMVRKEDLQRYHKIILEELELTDKRIRSNIDNIGKAKVKFYGNQVNTLYLGPDPIFRGVLVSTLECLECNHTSQRTEPFLDISLPIMNDKPQPPIVSKRKCHNQMDNLMNNSTGESSTLSKKQVRKQKKDQRKNQKKLSLLKTGGESEPSDDLETVTAEETGEQNCDENESVSKADAGDEADEENGKGEESDADIEDNVEGEIAKNMETIESGYSSEKTGQPSPTESMKPLMLSEVETDELRSSPEIENPLGEALANGIHEITDKLSKIKVQNSEKSCQHPKRYKCNEDDCSVQSCLNQFTALELLNGNNKVGCEACTNEKKNDDDEHEKNTKSFTMVYTSSSKQYLIAQIPAVLILHFKRFQSYRYSSFRKVGKHVSFPLLLDISPVCKNYRKPKIYSLYGIVEHSGTLHGGHYVAYVKSRMPLEPDDPRWSFLPKKHAAPEEDVQEESSDEAEFNVDDIKPPPGRWYYVSDGYVNEVDEASVLQKEAYLLFYERIK